MGRYVRWQTIIAFLGTILLVVYLSSIVLVKTTIVVPAEGGTYREGVIGGAQYLNPLLAEYNPVDLDIAGLIFEGLTRDDGQGNLSPVLAENWSESADGRIYVFTLRQDVKWSDGKQFTANDVIFTLNLMQSPDFPGNRAWQTLWQSVEIEAVDDYTLRFILQEPFPSFIYYTTVGILPQHLLRDVPARDLLTHSFNLSPVGTGPFQLDSLTEHQAVLVRNPRFRNLSSRIAKLVFKFYADSGSLQQAFQNQVIDGIGQATLPVLKQLQTEGNVQFYSAPLPHYDIVYFNLQSETLPFFQESTVRQALFMLLDRQAIIDKTLSGQAVLSNGNPILPWSWAFNPTQEYPGYNPSRATELLTQAGWIDSNGDGIRDNNGTPFEFVLLVSNNSVQSAVARSIARQWQNAGIDATVEIVDAGLPAQLAQHQFEAALIEVELFGDPDPYRFWHQTQSDGGQNFSSWDNVEASQALEQGRTAIQQADRIQYYYDFQRVFAEELPAIILFYPVYTYTVRDTVKNVQLSPIVSSADRFRDIGEWYLLTKRIIETNANQALSQ